MSRSRPTRAAALAFGALALGALAACNDDDEIDTGVGRTAAAPLVTAAGQSAGTVTLTQTDDGVQVVVQATGLPTGVHGFHFHEVGQCAAPFTSAGEHYNPTARQHGIENPQGPHASDLPNLVVTAAGTASLTTVTPYLTLRDGESNTVLDANGTALIIHASADDYRTDPSGNSGARIACGVVARTN